MEKHTLNEIVEELHKYEESIEKFNNKHKDKYLIEYFMQPFNGLYIYVRDLETGFYYTFLVKDIFKFDSEKIIKILIESSLGEDNV